MLFWRKWRMITMRYYMVDIRGQENSTIYIRYFQSQYYFFFSKLKINQMTLFKSIHHNKHSFCSKYQLCELNQRKEIDIQQNMLQNNFCDYFKFNSFQKILLAAHTLFSNPVVFWWMDNTNFIVQWPWNSYNNVRFGRSY